MKYIIDRFEGPFAVCEGEDHIIVRLVRTALPAKCREGSTIETTENGIALIDNSDDRSRIKRKMSALFKAPKDE